MKPALFFDRDNTLIVNDGYLGDPSTVTLVDGAAIAVAMAVRSGLTVVTVSNQSGVARGYFTEADVIAINGRMDGLLIETDADAMIARHYYCPNLPDAPVERYRLDNDLRKPGPGMLLLAARELDLDLKASWLIGDAERDIQAAHAAGCRAVMFDPPGVTPSPAAATGVNASAADYRTSSLQDAVKFVLQNG